MLIKIDHPLPSSEERRKSVTDKLARGERLGASHNVDYATTEARVLAHMGYSVLAPCDRARWDKCPPRKRISERTCHGKDVACLPGLNGKCVACFDDD